jgi:hypothetical protein
MREWLQALAALLAMLLFIAVLVGIGVALDLYSRSQGWF